METFEFVQELIRSAADLSKIGLFLIALYKVLKKNSPIEK